MSCPPHVVETISKVLRQKSSLEVWLNRYTTCSYDPDVDVRHFKKCNIGSGVNGYS